MTYAALKSQMGKEFVVIVELYIDECQLVYGVAPCTAVVPTTGSQKCFNTIKTCQDTDNYDRGVAADRKIYRFATTSVAAQTDGDTPTFPTVQSVDTAPTKLTPGKGLGIRSSVSITLTDHPWTDVGVDPYYRTRTYVPDSQGSFWGKFLARNPNYENRRIDILTGYLTADSVYDVANFKRRTYLLSKISGPDTDGRVRIEARDPLRKTDLSKAQWPKACRAVLTTEALLGDTVLYIGDPDGAVVSNFALGQKYVRVDDEIMKVVSYVDDGGGFLAITVSRSDSPSNYDNSLNVQATHSLGVTLQTCWFFDAQRIDYVLYTLLADASNISTAYLPVSDWSDAVTSDGLDNYLLTALITAPEGVDTLLDELAEHGIYMWWDERQQLVLIKTNMTQAFDDTPVNEDSDIIAGSVSITRSATERISQAWMYYGLRSPTIDMELLSSYSSLLIKIDSDAESAEQYDQRKVRNVFSRWLPVSKSSTASEISGRLLREYRDSKIIMSLSMDAKNDAAWTGDLLGVLTSLVQDESGAPLASNYTVIEVDEVVSDSGVFYRYTLQAAVTVARAGVISPDLDFSPLTFGDFDLLFDGDQLVSGSETTPFPDYTDSSSAQKAHYAFISPDSGIFADGTTAYEIR